jgi:cell division protein FtsI/penicillin-binding protein 2
MKRSWVTVSLVSVVSAQFGLGCVHSGAEPVPPGEAAAQAEQVASAPVPAAAQPPVGLAAPRQVEELDAQVPDRLREPPLATAKPLPGEDDPLMRAQRRADGKYVVETPVSTAVLTLYPPLHDKLRGVLKSARSLYSAAVAIEPSTGRVLAMSEHSEVNPAFRGLTTKAVFPAASVFKLITTSALLQEGLAPEDQVCSHGGYNAITRDQLLDSPLDRECHTLTAALGRSINAVFAKLTFKYLTAEKLRARAEAFGWNRAWVFPVPTEISLASFGGGPVRVAATGAGFGDVYLSPLHGAVIAATTANRGIWRNPVLFEHDAARAASAEGTQVISPPQAQQLAGMLQQTITEGTASRVFGEHGHLSLRAVGKTGTLSDVHARQYSWFIGFAPREDPRVAVAAVTVSEPGKKTPAAWVGREAMRLYLEARSREVWDPMRRTARP